MKTVKQAKIDLLVALMLQENEETQAEEEIIKHLCSDQAVVLAAVAKMQEISETLEGELS